MNIGIITFWESSDNYGQQLQCWALQQHLRNEGHTPYLIRFKRWHPTIGSSAKDYLRYKAKQFVYLLTDILQIVSGKNRQFSTFKKKNIVSSKEIYDNYAQLCSNPPAAEAYITGSDQVWNYEMRDEELKAFYLQFGDKETKRISYAASIGYTQLSEEIKPLMRVYLAAFNAISVREEKSVELIGSLGYNAKHVLDPTLLLRKKDYEILYATERRKQDFIFIYSLNYSSPDDLPLNSIIEYSKHNNKKIIVTKSRGVIKPEDFYHGVEYDYPTVSGWLRNINDADIVVTASFHGIVFAILFHKQFLFTPLQGWLAQSNVRAFSLISMLGLESQIWDGKTNIDCYMSKVINWDNVDATLDRKRQESTFFLEKSLE